MGYMDDYRQQVTDARFQDLKEVINTRFDDMNSRLVTISKQLDNYESKDHAASEINHLVFRCDDLEQKLQDAEDDLEKFKDSLYRKAALLATVLSSVVSIIFGILQFFIH
ncbi:MAG: hypothetical protein [Caudoviricetes sp.]|nr:MAG: hypothetical protein [Caudoviricetes sp.]